MDNTPAVSSVYSDLDDLDVGLMGSGDRGEHGAGPGGAGISTLQPHNTLSAAALRESDSRASAGGACMSARATIKGTSHADYMPFPFLEEVEVEGASRGGNVVDSLIDFSGPASGDVAFGTQDEWGGVGMAGLVEGGGGDRDGGWMGAGGAQAPLSHGSDGLG